MIKSNAVKPAGSGALVLGLLLAVFVMLLAAKSARAAIFPFVVNQTGDSADQNLADSFCDVNLFSPGIQCTLRAAIQEANDTDGPNTIGFNIGGTGVKTISPASQLPTIIEQVTIDGYTQPGASPNTKIVGDDAFLLVELDGRGAGEFTSGLRVSGSDSVVKGLVINRFGKGVEITGGTGTRIQGNFIGTDPSGTVDLGNRQDGVSVIAEDSTIGGTTPAGRNVISGNQLSGVSFPASFDGVGSGSRVMGNYIGTDRNGTGALGNCGGSLGILDDRGGVEIDGGSAIVVGGTSDGARNVISGNFRDGVRITGDTGNRVTGNFIGTDATGTAALNNFRNGVEIRDTSNHTVGGTVPGARNVISGNSGNGVLIAGEGESNKVQGNRIGTKKNGSGDLGNGGSGLFVDSSDNTIGGVTLEAANTIAFSENLRNLGRDGVTVAGGTGNRILVNEIFSNQGQGIDLSDDGPTANELGDEDTGPNGLQNFPVLNSAVASGDATTIKGKLNSAPDETFKIRFFSNPENTDEGKTFLGQKSVTTNVDGAAQFTFVSARSVPVGRPITATASDSDGNTSEYSAPRATQ
jgi:CSLREA domain-containing protein